MLKNFVTQVLYTNTEDQIEPLGKRPRSDKEKRKRSRSKKQKRQLAPPSYSLVCLLLLGRLSALKSNTLYLRCNGTQSGNLEKEILAGLERHLPRLLPVKRPF